MRRADDRGSGDLYYDGLTNVLAEPEFNASDEARRALRLFDERSLLQDLALPYHSTAGVGGVQVLIGGEERLGRAATMFDGAGPLRRPRPGDRHAGCAGPDAHVLQQHHPDRALCGRVVERPGERYLCEEKRVRTQNLGILLKKLPRLRVNNMHRKSQKPTTLKQLRTPADFEWKNSKP